MPQSWTERMAGAARLDAATYEEVEHDVTATGQAAAVVALAAIAQAIGAADQGAPGALGALAAGLLGWLAWAGITYLIGDKLLGGTATWGELLRTLGFAQAPGLLHVFGIIPLLGALVSVVVAIWILIAGVIAIRQALDFGTGRALITAFLGWLVLIVPMILLSGLAALLGAIF